MKALFAAGARSIQRRGTPLGRQVVLLGITPDLSMEGIGFRDEEGCFRVLLRLQGFVGFLCSRTLNRAFRWDLRLWIRPQQKQRRKELLFGVRVHGFEGLGLIPKIDPVWDVFGVLLDASKLSATEIPAPKVPEISALLQTPQTKP